MWNSTMPENFGTNARGKVGNEKMEISKAQIDDLLIYYAQTRKLYAEAKGDPQNIKLITGMLLGVEYALEVLGIDYTKELKTSAIK